MSTFLILLGFALMLLLPCAIAMFSSRDSEQSSAYADRVIPNIHTQKQALADATDTDTQELSTPAPESAELRLLHSTPATHHERILQGEIEALMAAAVAARAQADALAANARLAAAKAEAADAEALAAEDAADAAIQEIRHAA